MDVDVEQDPALLALLDEPRSDDNSGSVPGLGTRHTSAKPLYHQTGCPT